MGFNSNWIKDAVLNILLEARMLIAENLLVIYWWFKREIMNQNQKLKIKPRRLMVHKAGHHMVKCLQACRVVFCSRGWKKSDEKRNGENARRWSSEPTDYTIFKNYIEESVNTNLPSRECWQDSWKIGAYESLAYQSLRTLL